MILEAKRLADQIVKSAVAKKVSPVQKSLDALKKQLAQQRAATKKLIDAAKKGNKARSKQQTQEAAAIRGAKTSKPAAHTDAKFLPNIPTFSTDSDLNKLKGKLLHYMKETEESKYHPAFKQIQMLYSELAQEQKELTAAAQYLDDATEADRLLAHRVSMAHADKVLEHSCVQ